MCIESTINTETAKLLNNPYKREKWSATRTPLAFEDLDSIMIVFLYSKSITCTFSQTAKDIGYVSSRQIKHKTGTFAHQHVKEMECPFSLKQTEDRNGKKIACTNCWTRTEITRARILKHKRKAADHSTEQVQRNKYPQHCVTEPEADHSSHYWLRRYLITKSAQLRNFARCLN